MSTTLPLAKGGAALLDEQDLERCLAYRWYFGGRYVRAVRPWSEPCVLLHRFILGAERGTFVDHINGDPLDNRRSNLRLCSHAENLCNQRRHRDGSSVFKGVTWYKPLAKWRAQIKARGKARHLGYFDSQEAAARAYDAAAREAFGEFANPNFHTGAAL